MQYYILEQNLDDPDSAAIGEVPDTIEVGDWYDGKLLPAPPLPLILRLFHKSGELRSDIMGGVVTLYSDKMVGALKNYGMNSFQFFPVDVEDPTRHTIEKGYNIVNILGLIECIDPDNSVLTPGPMGGIIGIESFVIDPSKVHGESMFRLYEKPTLIIIDEKLKQHLDSADLVGLKTRKTQDYDGW